MRTPHAPARPPGELGAPGRAGSGVAAGVSPGGQLPTPGMGTQGGTAPPPRHGPRGERTTALPHRGAGTPRRAAATPGGTVRVCGQTGPHTAPRKHRLHINTAAPPQVHSLHTNTHTQQPNTHACTWTAHQHVYNKRHARYHTLHTNSCTCTCTRRQHANTYTHSLTAHQHTEYDCKLTHILHTKTHTRTNTPHVSTHTPIHIAHQHQVMCTYKSLVQYGKQAHMACTHESENASSQSAHTNHLCYNECVQGARTRCVYVDTGCTHSECKHAWCVHTRSGHHQKALQHICVLMHGHGMHHQDSLKLHVSHCSSAPAVSSLVPQRSHMHTVYSSYVLWCVSSGRTCW